MPAKCQVKYNLFRTQDLQLLLLLAVLSAHYPKSEVVKA